jgi:hypothetical protein
VVVTWRYAVNKEWHFCLRMAVNQLSVLSPSIG